MYFYFIVMDKGVYAVPVWPEGFSSAPTTVTILYST